MLRYILFVIGFAVLMLGVIPLWTVISNARTFKADLENSVDQLKALQVKKNDLVKTYNSASDENLQKLDVMIPTLKNASDLSAIYVFMENITRENGLKLKKVNVSTADAASSKANTSQARQPVTTVQSGATTPTVNNSASSQTPGKSPSVGKWVEVSMTVEGTYDSFKNFLKELELNLRLIDSSAVAVKPNLGKYSFDLTLKVYYQ